MTEIYSGNYFSDPFRPSTSPHLEPLNTTAHNAGELKTQFFSVNVPAGLSNVAPDHIRLMDFQESTFTGVQVVRFTRLYLNNTVNTGGAITANIGFITSAASVFAAASTVLQSAGVLDVAIATLFSTTLAVPDTLGLTIASAGPTTTASVLSGFVQFYYTRP